MTIITATNLDHNIVNPATSFNTATINPVVNRLYIVSVLSADANIPNAPTVTGCGITWTSITSKSSAAGHSLVTLFRGMSTSPSSGQLTIANGKSTTSYTYSIEEFVNVNTSGTSGSGAVVQSASATNTGTTTGISVTLSSFSGSLNATFGYGYMGAHNGIVKGANFTELSSQSNESSAEWAPTNQTTVDWTWASQGSNENVAAAIEIKAINTFKGAML